MTASVRAEIVGVGWKNEIKGSPSRGDACVSMKGSFIDLRWMKEPFIASGRPAVPEGAHAGSFRTVRRYAGSPRTRTGGTR